MPRKMENMVGMKFGNLTVKKYKGQRADGHYVWECVCACGNVKDITRNALMRAKEPTRSCGCKQKEAARNNAKHGHSGKKIHVVWTSMKQRCFNPRNPEFKNYGGRGITVCDRWKNSFANFLKDMGNPPDIGLGINKVSIDRIDNDGDYCPENCRWSTMPEQLFNRRRTIKITHNQVTLPLKIWCQKLGLNYSSARARFRAGRETKEILEKPQPRKNWVVTHDGITLPLKLWAKKIGVKYDTLKNRIAVGWPIAVALSAPLKSGKDRRNG